MANKTEYHGKKHFSQCFSRSRVLEYHVKNYLAINHTKSILLPEENEYANFQNFKRLTQVSFIIYWDFECVLIFSTDNINFGPHTKKYEDHIVCKYGYKLICVGGQYSKQCKTYFGEDDIDKFLNDMIKDSEYCSTIIETEFNKPVVMTEKDHYNFENSTKRGFVKMNMKEVK